MNRSILDPSKIHPAIQARVANHHRQTVEEVEGAIGENELVVVGMKGNPHCKAARKLLDAKGRAYTYLEYGSYLGDWRRRTALKMWTGWSTFPMVFYKGTLLGGASELAALLDRNEI